MLVKCPCQQCGVNIEFDPEAAGQFVACPSCGQQTRLLLPSKPTRNTFAAKPVNLTNADRGASRIFWWFLVVLIVSLVVVLIFQRESIGVAVAEALGLAGGAVIGIVALVVGFIGFILTVMWIIFPWMVYVLLKKIEANTRKE